MLETPYFAIHEGTLAEWEAAYPLLNVRGEVERMVVWLKANPRKAKKRLWSKFCTGWLAREHARIQRQQIESRAYARVGTLDESRAAARYEENLRIIAELGG